MADASKAKPKRGCWRSCLTCLGVIFALLLVAACIWGPGALEKSRENGAMQDARDLALTLFAYANDHGGKYPDGNSSTEVFQKLIDDGYLVDADDSGRPLDHSILYYPIPGKVPAAPGTKILKPENVCWDVTVPVDLYNSPDALPVIYLTGRKVNFTPGGSAVLIPHPPRTWLERLEGKEYPDKFIAVAILNQGARGMDANPDGSIPNFVAPDINLGDVKYHQLGPDGPVGP